MKQNRTITLDEAIRNESQRKNYLVEEFSSVPIKYCQRIFYDPDRSLNRDWLDSQREKVGLPKQRIEQEVKIKNASDFIAGFNLPVTLFGSGHILPLFAGRRLFSGELNEDEISHLLSVHEGTHLRQIAIGFPYFDNTDFRKAIRGDIRLITAVNIAELDANYESLMSIKRSDFQVREGYYQGIVTGYKQGIVSLYNLLHDSKNDAEKKFIKQILEKVPHSTTIKRW